MAEKKTTGELIIEKLAKLEATLAEHGKILKKILEELPADINLEEEAREEP